MTTCEWNDCGGCEACPDDCRSCTGCQRDCECYAHDQADAPPPDGPWNWLGRPVPLQEGT